MSSDESDDYSIDDEMSWSKDDIIELLERIDSPVKYLEINFYLDDVDVDPSDAVEIILYNEDYCEVGRFSYTLSDPAEWERLGGAIGCCSSIQDIRLDKFDGEMDQIDALDQKVYQCIETLYRGLEANTSIVKFELDMDLFPSSGVFPTLNLNGAQFKENLKHLTLSSEIPIEINQSLMILPLLESTSLDSFDIRNCMFSTEEAVYTRIISACTRVKRLDIKFMDTTECATTLATLFRDRRSTLSEFSVYENMSAENLFIILDGLASNTTLKTMFLTNDDLETSNFERLLCNTSSIEGIHNSNHTLEVLILDYMDMDVLPFVSECLELNKDTNKDKVIRTKIARYYFRGEFDIAPFVNMNVKLLPKVMAMIEGDDISRRDAIYRLLKSIPDLCTFHSGLSSKRKNNN